MSTTLLSVAIQPIPYLLSGPSVKSMYLQFRDEDVEWNSVKTYGQWMEPQGLWTILFGQSLLDVTELFFIVLEKSCYWEAAEGDTQSLLS